MFFAFHRPLQLCIPAAYLPMSPPGRQREKRIDLVLRQPQHPADLAIRGTELVAEFPGEIKSLRFGQVFNRGDIVI